MRRLSPASNSRTTLRLSTLTTAAIPLLQALHTRPELALAGKLDEQAYRDFIVDQGLLPLDLLDKAVMEEFVAARRKQ